MADPITWGLINLVKKGVKGVQTTLDGVSDKVSGLPDSLSADFTQVKQAIADVKTDVGGVNTAVSNVNTAVSGVKTDVGSVNTAVSSVKEDTTSIKDTVDTSTLLSADSVVKSVQRGVFSGSILLGYTNPTTATVTKISTVNTNKAILIINNFGAGPNGYEGRFSFKLNASTISVGYSETNSVSLYGLDWQVIEFY